MSHKVFYCHNFFRFIKVPGLFHCDANRPFEAFIDYKCTIIRLLKTQSLLIIFLTNGNKFSIIYKNIEKNAENREEAGLMRHGPVIIITILFMLYSPLFAQEFIGLGMHAGLHHDVGNQSNQNRMMDYEVQNNVLLGFSFKVNMYFLFVRTGCDVSFVLNKAKVENSSDELESMSLSYINVPAFLGLRFPLREMGELYMGMGISYHVGEMKYRLASASTSDDTLEVALGYGFVTGIEFKLFPFARIYMEWQYFDSRSDAAINTEGATYKDYHIDFSGHRIFLGAMYYII